ncbi:MAG: hypothetical protein RQ767_06555, partial [Thermovirgaceae bacterium]|nr:hypothetical protein [Thermovirgaceae bacterium]
VVTYEDSETGERRQDMYTKGKMRFGDSVVTRNYVIVADSGSQSYWKGTPKQYCDALSKMKKKMEEQLASLPAEYRPKPIDNSQVSRQKIGTRSIAGYTATGYDFFVGEIGQGAVWVSSDPALSELISLQNTKNNEYECFDEKMGSDIEDSTLYEKTIKGAFVLKEDWQQVLSVERKNVSSGIFDTPKGYKSFSDYQQFTEYISNNHSRPSSDQFYGSEEYRPSDDYMQADERRQETYRAEDEGADETAPTEQGLSRKMEDNIVAQDAKDIASDSAREARQSTKRGIQKEISKDIQKGVGGFLKKIF